MITINRQFIIQIQINDASRAIKNEGVLAEITSKLPFINKIIDGKVEDKIKSEILNHLSNDAIQGQIQRTLNDKGIQAEVRVS